MSGWRNKEILIWLLLLSSAITYSQLTSTNAHHEIYINGKQLGINDTQTFQTTCRRSLKGMNVPATASLALYIYHLTVFRVMWVLCTSSTCILAMVQISKHGLEICKRSCRHMKFAMAWL